MRKQSAETKWKIGKKNERVIDLVVPWQSSGDRFRWLALADLHWDSAHCDRDILARHLAQAKAEDAPIVVVGDMFDLMQGRWDPRADQNTLRPEHRGNRYLDLVTATAVEWFAPYAKQLALVIGGNHEASILRRHQMDILDRFCWRMREHGSPVIYGPDWCFLRQINTVCKSHNATTTFLQHGYGGGGEVTRGLIDHSRTRGQWDADIYISGHIHRRNMDENVITRCSVKGYATKTTQTFLRCGSYKHEENDAWHISKGRAARPIGGWWITTEMRRSAGEITYRTIIETP